MSSKEKKSIKKGDGKAALVPKLRFPDFRGAGGWEYDALGNVCEILNNRRRPITSSEREPGPYPYFGASGVVDFVKEYIFDERLLLVGEDGAKWEAFEKTAFIVEGKYWVNNHAHVLKPFAISDTFLENYLTLSDLSPFITGAAPPKLTLGKLKSIPVPIPPSAHEQQKIADCLSSVDEAIGAQVRKVDALKTHKKGLIQELFPREGQSLPRRRFPEFQNAGEWLKHEVSTFAKVTTGGKDTQNKVEGGSYPFFVRSQTVERINSYSYDGEAVLTSGDGVGVGKNYHYIKGKFDFHQRVYCIYDFSECVNGLFFYLYFSEHFGERVMKMSAKNSVDSVRMPMITEMPVLLPTLLEQKRIADCLSSLDDLIVAQAQKLEALKAHKKGLMQQLFPSPDEVES